MGGQIMQNKKSTAASKKSSAPKTPSVAERITDFSTGGISNIRFIPKKKNGK